MFKQRMTCGACLLGPVAVFVGVAGGAPVAFPVSAGGTGHEYEIIVDDTLDRAGAAAVAAATGGHLVSINSANEQAFVQQMLYSSNSPTGGYWIGLERVGSGGQGVADDFRWDTGEALGYENFATGEPNAYLDMEDAAQIYWSADLVDDVNTRRGGWNDVPVSGYASTPVTDLVTAGFIIERTEVGEDTPPVAIPLPPAVLAAPLALLGAGWMTRRKRRLA